MEESIQNFGKQTVNDQRLRHAETPSQLCSMPKRMKVAGSAAVQPSKGQKTVFGDDETLHVDFQTTNGKVEVVHDEHEDSDDDDAPETVGMGAGRTAEESKQQKAQT